MYIRYILRITPTTVLNGNSGRWARGFRLLAMFGSPRDPAGISGLIRSEGNVGHWGLTSLDDEHSLPRSCSDSNPSRFVLEPPRKCGRFPSLLIMFLFPVVALVLQHSYLAFPTAYVNSTSRPTRAAPTLLKNSSPSPLLRHSLSLRILVPFNWVLPHATKRNAANTMRHVSIRRCSFLTKAFSINLDSTLNPLEICGDDDKSCLMND